MLRLVGAIVFAFLIPLSNFGNPARGDGEKAAAGSVEDLLRLDREFDEATARGGAEAWVSYFAENGSMLGAQGAPVTGHEAIRKAMSPRFANPDFSLRWRPQRAEILIPGDLGFTLGRYERRLKNSEGKLTVEHGTYFTLWRKQANGAWKVVADTGAADGPPQAGD